VDIVANGDTRGSHNGLLYGIIGALCVVLIGGGIYIFKTQDKPVEPAVQAAKPAPRLRRGHLRRRLRQRRQDPQPPRSVRREI
jgi:hypothetical protein